MIYTHALVAIVSGAVAFGAAWRVQSWRHDSAELARAAPSLSIHKRISVMRLEKGWQILKKREEGKLTVYFGTPPKAK